MGVGEVCTLGSSYLPAYSKGVRSGILEIGQSLIGKDPSEISNINLEMEKNSKVILMLNHLLIWRAGI